jgi:hypothetical protein
MSAASYFHEIEKEIVLDPTTEKFKNDNEANAMLSRKQRKDMKPCII